MVRGVSSGSNLGNGRWSESRPRGRRRAGRGRLCVQVFPSRVRTWIVCNCSNKPLNSIIVGLHIVYTQIYSQNQEICIIIFGYIEAFIFIGGGCRLVVKIGYLERTSIFFMTSLFNVFLHKRRLAYPPPNALSRALPSTPVLKCSKARPEAP